MLPPSSASATPPPLILTDLAATAFANISGFPHASVISVTENRAAFVFENPSSDLLVALADYYLGRGSISPIQFDKRRAQLRRQIGEVLRQGVAR